MTECNCNYCTINPNAWEEDKEILRLHKLGTPAVEIAARLNVYPELVRRRLRRAGFEPVPAPKFLKAEELRSDIIRLHQQGLPPLKIAERLGVESTVVYRRLRDAKLEPRPSPEDIKRTLESLDEIIALGKRH
ncbi:MAG: hypothetical protein KAW83_03780 [Dehalococcoidia bacterium]|nr:hypothetical protein [Dehalococcoidia bacterium]